VSYLLDTNVVAEIRKPRPHPSVSAWFTGVSGGELFLSVLVLGEIRQGIDRIRKRDPRRAAVYEAWLTSLRRDFGDRILPVDEEVALEWGRLNAPDPLPVVDGLMAATAVVRGLTYVTRDVAGLTRAGVTVLNPFEP
jgi:predicted nucleic acid-binding protein